MLRRRKPDALQGTLDLLVLKTLSRGPQHGYGIASYVQTVSEDALRVEEGSLYPALHRMEQTGWISAAWQITEKNRRARVYRLTRAGRARLADEQEKWMKLTIGVGKILRAT
jgi:PadR family transcriptional regulator PadR